MSATESIPSSPIVKVVEQPVPFVPSPRFLKIRNIVFGCVFALSFVWTVLLCVAIFAQWTVMDLVERYLIIIILLVQFLTLVLVPLLLAGEFRPWLDAARSLCLFAAHFGVAVWFIAKAPAFKCSSGSADQMAVCNFGIIFILTANWVIPTLVLGYAGGLAYFMRRMSKLPVQSPSELDVEKHTFEKADTRVSVPPSTYRISRMPQTPATPASISTFDRQRRQSAPYSIHSNATRMSRGPPATPIYGHMPQQSGQRRSVYRQSVVPYPTTPLTPLTPNPYGGIYQGRPRVSALPPLNTSTRQVPPGMYYTAPPMQPSATSQTYAPYYGLPSAAMNRGQPPQPPPSTAVTPSTAKPSLQQQQQQQRQAKTSSQQSSVYSQASYAYAQ